MGIFSWTKINNPQCDFKELKSQGLKLRQKKKFNEFLYQYGKTRVLDGYASVLQDETGHYFKKVSTNQIIKLVEFDHYFGNFILKYLLDFEQRFSTVLISTLLKEYNLGQDYVLRQDNCPWLVFKSLEERNDFFNTTYQKVDSSNFLRKYSNKKEIPLISLSLSWTFFNVIMFYEATDIQIQTKVIEGLGLENWNIDVFKSMLHIIRRLRNTISHNDFLIDSKFEIYKTLIKKANLREDKTFFYIYDVCKLLDIVYPIKNGFTTTLEKMINKQKFSIIVKEKVLELLGADEQENGSIHNLDEPNENKPKSHNNNFRNKKQNWNRNKNNKKHHHHKQHNHNKNHKQNNHHHENIKGDIRQHDSTETKSL